MTNIQPCPNDVEMIARALEYDWDGEGPSYTFVRNHFLPKSPAQQLAEECPRGMTEEQAQWVLDRESNLQKTQIATDAPLVDKTTVREVNEKLGNCTPTDPAPRYVFGPWVEVEAGTNPLPHEVEYEQSCVPGIAINDADSQWVWETRVRRAYRIGVNYSHDGGECPLADGSVRVRREIPGSKPLEGFAGCIIWPNVTSFTPLDQGSGQ